MTDQLAPKQTGNEIEDDITELELEDDAFEKKMRRLEAEAERLLHHSNELLKELNKARAKREDSELKEME